MQVQNSGFIFSDDPRDNDFAFAEKIKGGSRPPINQKEWWSDGWWGSQGATPHCCAYSWVHILEDGPVVQDGLVGRPAPMFPPAKFFEQCKLIDGLPENAQGTTIRAGANVAKRLGLISEYRWAKTVDEIVDALIIFGPVIAGTVWRSDMNAGPDGIMRNSGKSYGGHAYVINGVDIDKQTFRIKNSYGKKWGKNGYGFLSFKDMEDLLKEGGTICVPFEKKLTNIPKL